jgi:hypothetical protein
MLEINGETTTYEELKQKGTLQNYINTHFDGTYGELEEMEELLIKIQVMTGKSTQTDTILL